MTRTVFLDKSFLFSTKTERFRELAQKNRFAICDATLFELMTTPEPERTKCMKKFGPGVVEIDLVSFVGPMIHSEIAQHRPAGVPSRLREQGNFAFNKKLFDGSYELPIELSKVIEAKAVELQKDVGMLVSRAASVPSHFPALRYGVRSTLEDAEKSICTPGALLQIYASLPWPDPRQTLPNVSIVNESWAIYRFIQVQMLFALDIHFRYNGKEPETNQTNQYERIEHDMLDSEQLVLGCLQGAFATREKKLARWFKMLCPRGWLLED